MQSAGIGLPSPFLPFLAAGRADDSISTPYTQLSSGCLTNINQHRVSYSGRWTMLCSSLPCQWAPPDLHARHWHTWQGVSKEVIAALEGHTFSSYPQVSLIKTETCTTCLTGTIREKLRQVVSTMTVCRCVLCLFLGE